MVSVVGELATGMGELAGEVEELATVVSVEDPMPSVEATVPSVGATVPSVGATVPSVEATVLSAEATVPSFEATVLSAEVTVPSVEATGVPVGTVASVVLLPVALASLPAVPPVFAVLLELSSAVGADPPDESVVATLELGSLAAPSFLICSGVFLLLHFGWFLGQGGKNGGRS